MTARRALTGLRPGDHVCCTLESEAEQQMLVSRYLGDALSAGERVIYVTDRTEESQIRSWVSGAGIDVDAHLSNGQLEIWPADAVYGPADRFDPQRQIAVYQSEVERSHRNGYERLAVYAEMSWALADLDAWKRVSAYEREVARILARAGATAVCQYDRRLFPQELLADAFAAHPARIECCEAGSSSSWYGAAIRESEAGPHLRVSGELDLACAGYLSARLAEHIGGGADIVVDAGELTFADVSGCRALIEVAGRLEPPQRLILTDPPGSVRRVFALCEFEAVPQLEIRMGER